MKCGHFAHDGDHQGSGDHACSSLHFQFNIYVESWIFRRVNCVRILDPVHHENLVVIRKNNQVSLHNNDLWNLGDIWDGLTPNFGPRLKRKATNQKIYGAKRAAEDVKRVRIRSQLDVVITQFKRCNPEIIGLIEKIIF